MDLGLRVQRVGFRAYGFSVSGQDLSLFQKEEINQNQEVNEILCPTIIVLSSSV